MRTVHILSTDAPAPLKLGQEARFGGRRPRKEPTETSTWPAEPHPAFLTRSQLENRSHAGQPTRWGQAASRSDRTKPEQRKTDTKRPSHVALISAILF